ncbi:MAG: hypothetical protein WEA77_12910 [Hyphomonas sp.]|uniref:hypothetical protein n=1 Tax=Hyphomonas sp. TaxID=87 RepID=UPI0034A05858
MKWQSEGTRAKDVAGKGLEARHDIPACVTLYAGAHLRGHLPAYPTQQHLFVIIPVSPHAKTEPRTFFILAAHLLRKSRDDKLM